jgi:hypothetical protein
MEWSASPSLIEIRSKLIPAPWGKATREKSKKHNMNASRRIITEYFVS